MADVSPAYIASTMKLLQTGNFDMKLLTLCQRPISPPDEGNPMRAFPVSTAGAANVPTFGKTTVRDNDEKIGFIKLEAGVQGAAGAMSFKVKSPAELPDAGARAGYIPCWFLPWRSGNIIKIKIASLAASPQITFGGGIAPVDNPGLFFTAAINGCSVFAIGDTKAPSLYHGGASTAEAAGMNLGPNETTEQGWERLLAAGRRNKNLAPKPMGSVGKTDYVSELKSGYASNADRLTSGALNQKTTAQAIRLEQTLAARGQVAISSVAPWGAVFGLRDSGGDWQFNLVRNATVTYTRITEPPSRKQKMLGAIQSGVKRLGFGGDGDDQPKNLISMSQISAVNLGFKKFFPGTGVEHYRDLHNVVVV